MKENREWIHKLRDLFFSAKLEEVRVNEAIELKFKYIPKRLFKYRKYGDGALDNLNNDTLWCDSAKNFNDPYDTSIHFSFSQKSLGEQLIKSIEEQEKNRESNFLSSEEFQKISQSVDPDKELADLVAQKYNGEISADKLYDFLNKSNNTSIAKMNSEYNRITKLGYKMCSLSERVDSILMWSHYSLEHTGFVMEYDFSQYSCDDLLTRFLWPIIYDEKLFDASKFFEESLNGGMANNMLGIIASIHKAQDWSYEKEWRFILPKGPNEASLNYAMPKVKSIYVGALTLPKDEKKLIEIGKNKKISVYKMRLSQSEFKMLSDVVYEP